MVKRIVVLLIFSLVVSNAAWAQEEHQEIEGPFSSPQEVTETCLTCHEEVGDAILQTRHWHWQGETVSLSGEKKNLGKENMINNFCIAVNSNWPRCTSCHIGYGWKDKNFDFSDPNNIDCLICHDKTGTYKKMPPGAGMPDPNVDLVAVARSVGATNRENCGTCHFYGGGANGVKHADLDDSLLKPSKDLDVHMGGQDFSCTECHQTENHDIKGVFHGAKMDEHISCLDCHDSAPHEKERLNQHVSAVACETCHIPLVGRGNPTKIWWDWSTAGRDETSPKDEFGKDTYSKKKGSFKWAKNFVPEYHWHNGRIRYYTPGYKINPDKVVKLNQLMGNIRDADAKIYPFKKMRGKQIYDKKYNYLIVPKLFGENGYWKTFDWSLASKLGMESVGLDFSGEYGFVETEFFIPVNHMVAPKEKALKCWDCHHKTKGRLDWKALGYPGDPMSKKGRKANGLID